jgi:hypothetical protein
MGAPGTASRMRSRVPSSLWAVTKTTDAPHKPSPGFYPFVGSAEIKVHQYHLRLVGYSQTNCLLRICATPQTSNPSSRMDSSISNAIRNSSATTSARQCPMSQRHEPRFVPRPSSVLQIIHKSRVWNRTPVAPQSSAAPLFVRNFCR